MRLHYSGYKLEARGIVLALRKYYTEEKVFRACEEYEKRMWG